MKEMTVYLYPESKLLLKEICFDTLYSVDVENNQISGFWNSAPLLLHPIPYQWIPGWRRNNMSGWLSGAHSRDRVSVSVSPEVLILELITFEILAAERLRLMGLNNRLIGDYFANIVILLI